MKKQILVVEDEQDLRESVAEILRMEGYDVETAANGEVALQKLDDGVDPALILLDLMMPVMDGWEFRETQLDATDYADVPVVLFTSSKDVEESREQLRPAAVLRKPVGIDKLIKAVTEHSRTGDD